MPAFGTISGVLTRWTESVECGIGWERKQAPGEVMAVPSQSASRGDMAVFMTQSTRLIRCWHMVVRRGFGQFDGSVSLSQLNTTHICKTMAPYGPHPVKRVNGQEDDWILDSARALDSRQAVLTWRVRVEVPNRLNGCGPMDK
jgi:hypothetical protein